MFSIDYINLMITLLSPDKRSSSIIALNTPAAIELQNLNDDMFITYKTYQSIPEWSSLGDYIINNKVKYNKAIYKSAIDNNKNIPTYDDTWVLISPNFLGVDTRIAFNSQKIILEYALNIWFNTLYVQEPGVSEIFITLNSAIKQSPFILGTTENKSSKITTTDSDSYIGIDYSFEQYNGFTINVPIAVYNLLGANDAERQSTIRIFANQYVNIGVYYLVQSY